MRLEVAGSRTEKVVSHSLSHGDEKSTTCAQTSRSGCAARSRSWSDWEKTRRRSTLKFRLKWCRDWQTKFAYNFRQQLTVNQVSGAMVADWDVANNELKVLFIEPVQKNRAIHVDRRVAPAARRQVEHSAHSLPSAERETGGVGVEVLGAGEIKERQPNGLEDAEAGELGQLISNRQSPSLIAFRLQPADGKSDRTLSLERCSLHAASSADCKHRRSAVQHAHRG